jgi:LCP family protein required for cell wall assembly
LRKPAGTLRLRVNGVSSLRIFFNRVLVAFVVALVVSGGVIAGATVIEDRRLSSIHRIKLPDNILADSKPGEPANYLIIGSDTRSFVDTPGEAQAFGSNAEIGNARSDVMMIVHLVPKTGAAYVVSFPRDTYVDIPGHGTNLLNAAFAFGGPALAIKTFREEFGIPIQHYLAVNFVGFENIVKSIGHVKIFFPTPARDFFSQLDQPKAGCISLDGAQALAYARSRHYSIPKDGVENPDPNNEDDWMDDPRQDLDRIQRQQYFLRSLGQTALEHGASNIKTAINLTGAVSKSLTLDETLGNKELKKLILAFRGFDPATVEMTTIPIEVDGSRLVVQYPEAQSVIDRLKNLSEPVALPQLVEPSKMNAVVVDGSGVDGRAKSVNDALIARGFKAGSYGDADQNDYAKTQVRYAAGDATKGLTMGLYLGTSNVVEVADTTVKLADKELHGDVIVVVGRDYPKLKGLLSQPIPTSTTHDPTVSTTTSTTVPSVTPDTRYVPVAKEGLGPLVGCP